MFNSRQARMIAAYILLTIGANPVVAADKKPLISVGLSTKAAPYVVSIEDKSGVDIEVIEAALEQAGYRAEFHDVPLNRQNSAWEETKLDAVTLWQVPEGLSCSLSTPYRYWKDALFIADRPDLADVQSLADLRGMRLGTFRGALNHVMELRQSGWNQENIQEISYIQSGAKLLTYGRLDAYIGDYFGVQYTLDAVASLGKQKVRLVKFFSPEPQYVCFREAAMAKAFNDGLARLLADPDDSIHKIAARYGAGVSLFTPLQ